MRTIDRSPELRNHTFLRLMTLLCFFHFSGLNNGLSVIIISPDRVIPANFAPVFIQNIARVSNPLRLLKCFSFRPWKQLARKSGAAIESASKEALESILLEAALAQIVLSHTLNAFSAKTSGGASLAKSSAAFPKNIFSLPGAVNRAEKRFGQNAPAASINPSRQDSWLKLNSWNPENLKNGWVSLPLDIGYWIGKWRPLNKDQLSATEIRLWDILTRAISSQKRLRYFFVLKSGKDDLTATNSKRIVPPKKNLGPRAPSFFIDGVRHPYKYLYRCLTLLQKFTCGIAGLYLLRKVSSNLSLNSSEALPQTLKHCRHAGAADCVIMSFFVVIPVKTGIPSLRMFNKINLNDWIPA